MPFPYQSAYECAQRLNSLEYQLGALEQLLGGSEEDENTTHFEIFAEAAVAAGFHVTGGDIDFKKSFPMYKSIALTGWACLGTDAHGNTLLRYAHNHPPGRVTSYQYIIDPFWHSDYAPT